MSDVPAKELYIPAEKLNDNVKRMAWLLFLEEWKKDARLSTETVDVISLDGVRVWTDDVYKRCLAAAKTVWDMQEQGYDRV